MYIDGEKIFLKSEIKKKYFALILLWTSNKWKEKTHQLEGKHIYLLTFYLAGQNYKASRI